MAGPFWPKPPESDWEKARRERQVWQEEQEHLERMRTEEERLQREWEKQYREDIGNS